MPFFRVIKRAERGTSRPRLFQNITQERSELPLCHLDIIQTSEHLTSDQLNKLQPQVSQITTSSEYETTYGKYVSNSLESTTSRNQSAVISSANNSEEITYLHHRSEQLSYIWQDYDNSNIYDTVPQEGIRFSPGESWQCVEWTSLSLE